MSKSTRIAFAVFLSISFFFSAFIAAVRIMALENFEIQSHYFAHGERLSEISNYLLLASVLIFFVCGLFLRGKVSLTASERGVPFYFGNAILGASLAAYALFSFPIFFDEKKFSLTTSPLTGGLALFCTLFAVIGVFFCIHNCLFPNAERNRRLLFGLSIPLFAVANVLSLYFDTLTPMNAPNKLLDQFSFVFVALYMLYELRVLIDQPRYAAQCSLGLMTMVFTAANGFPSFIYMCKYGTPLSDNASHDILMIAFFFYVAIRMVHIALTESARDDRVLELLIEAEHPSTDLALRADSIEGENEKEELNSQLTFDTVSSLDIDALAAEEDTLYSEDGHPITNTEILDGGIEEEAPTEKEEERNESASDESHESNDAPLKGNIDG